MPEAKRSIVINVSPEVLFKVITDYARYPEFLREVDSVEIVSQNGHQTRARYTINVIKRISYTLDLTAVPNTSLSWSLVESSIMKSNNGGWTLEDLGDGRTRAIYGIDVTPKGMFVPKRVIGMLTDKSLPKTLEAFKARAESLS